MPQVESARMNRSWQRLWLATLISGVVALAFLAGSASPARAEIVHLASGEVIQGKIIRVDDATLSIESDKGYGVIQLNKSDITMIEYENRKRDPSRTVGVGYFHRNAPTVATSATTDYGVDALSLKYWLSAVDSVDALLGYFNSTTNGTTQLQILSMDLRYANVFQRRGLADLYYGLSLGFISVTDKANDVNDSGVRGGVFLGTEMFFATFPNLGISAEVGFYTQSVGKRTVTDLSTSTFPTFAVRYYF
jgi:hypothetical protein